MESLTLSHALRLALKYVHTLTLAVLSASEVVHEADTKDVLMWKTCDDSFLRYKMEAVVSAL